MIQLFAPFCTKGLLINTKKKNQDSVSVTVATVTAMQRNLKRREDFVLNIPLHKQPLDRQKTDYNRL